MSLTLLSAKRISESKVARWLGEDSFQSLVKLSLGLRFPVPVANIPGQVIIYDGCLYGTFSGGDFASLSDIIYAATNGKRQSLEFYKSASVSATRAWESLWVAPGLPAAGASAPAIPAGGTCTRTTTGALKQANPSGSDTLRLVSLTVWASSHPNTLIVYDRLWHGAVALNTTSSQSITGTPSRYTGTNARGNIAFVEVTTALANTAHNWTLTYLDENGTSRTSTTTGIAAAGVGRIDHANWFIPLAANSYGVQAATSIQLSATLSSGAANLVIGHPLVFVPQPQNDSVPVIIDGINSLFGLVQIQTDAALSFLSIRDHTGATNYYGQLVFVSG